MLDDLGGMVLVPRPPHRVISLVPSLTEAIAVSIPGALIGATNWCTHPAGLAVHRVRGPKNPDLNLIKQLSPDLVVANQEENRRHDVERLRAAHLPVWVTRTDSVPEALASMRRLFKEAFGLTGLGWLNQANAVWNRPPRWANLRVAVPVWQDPWIWVGAATYPNDVLHRLGATNVVPESRYPHLEPAEILQRQPDLIVLPDEPYPFSAATGLEIFLSVKTVCIAGRALFWYGPAMVAARAIAEDALRA